MTYKILLLLGLINVCSGYIYSKCDFYNDLDTCIDNTLCQWCSNNITNVSICKTNSDCLYNNTDCVSNNKLNNVCNVLDIFISISLIFMLFGSIIYISYFSSQIINKYFDIPNDNGDAITTRKKEKAIILSIINVLLFLNKTESFGYDSDDIQGPARNAFARDLNERINILHKYY